MTFTPHSRMVNPRLGTYFGIFAALLASVFFLVFIFEKLGVGDLQLRWMMLAAPIGLYGIIGVGSATSRSLDYFAAGRRVPAIFTGLSLAISAFGATGLASIAGFFFVSGYDALAVTIGGLAGFVVMGILLAPFVRKFGAYTVATYLGRRFESNTLRIVAAALLSLPLLLIIAAELRVGAYLAGWLVDWAPSAVLPLLTIAIVASLVLGGMRALSWSSAAQALTAILAIITMAAIVALIVTKIPIPQLSSGPIVRTLLRHEVTLGLSQKPAAMFALQLPPEGFVTLTRRFSTAFVDVGPAAFVVTLWTAMAGVASAPWLLPRVSATPSVYEARKSLGWATFFFGILALTIVSIAAFLREPVMDVALNGGSGEWMSQLVAAGLAEMRSAPARMPTSSLAFSRDGVMLALPIVTGLPAALVYLTAAGLIAAALAGAGATIVALANLMGEDMLNGLAAEPPADGPRLIAGRAMIVAAAFAGTMVALLAPTDPLKLLLWALTITAATAFPTLVLSIWWKRLNGLGALSSLVAGFVFAVLAIVAGEAHMFSAAGTVIAAFAIPLGFAIAIGVSLVTPAPSRHVLELARDIRVPGGEILYDREMHRVKLKQRRAPQ